MRLTRLKFDKFGIRRDEFEIDGVQQELKLGLRDISCLLDAECNFHGFLQIVLNSVDQKMVTTVAAYNRLRLGLWRSIDEEIKLSECRIYRYAPKHLVGLRFWGK